MRTGIVGGPLTGKSQLASAMADGTTKHYCTDPVDKVRRWTANTIYVPAGLAEDEGDLHVMGWLRMEGPLVLEGCMLARALRTFHVSQHASDVPLDRVIWLSRSYGELTSRQLALTKAVATVMKQLAPWLGSKLVVR
jgi:hypothetical protein